MSMAATSRLLIPSPARDLKFSNRQNSRSGLGSGLVLACKQGDTQDIDGNFLKNSLKIYVCCSQPSCQCLCLQQNRSTSAQITAL